jgi:hypothetical protein
MADQAESGWLLYLLLLAPAAPAAAAVAAAAAADCTVRRHTVRDKYNSEIG